MHPNSIYYQFDPNSIGWLHRKHRNGEEVTRADLADLLRADPVNGADPVMSAYLVDELEGNRKLTRGRKPPSPMHLFKLQMAEILVKDRADGIKSERKQAGLKHQRGDLEPVVQAAEEVGKFLCLPQGRSLLNAISALKKQKL